MFLATSLQRQSLLPAFLETQNGESKKAHWVGNKPPSVKQQGPGPGGPPGRLPKRSYRDLTSITLGEVQAAYKLFESQLISSPYPGWVGSNLFCVFDLKQSQEEYRPAAIFGRVRTCHPSDGYIHNIQMLELLFPRKEGAPDVVLVHREDIDTEKPVQSYGLRVRLLAAPDEVDDFSAAENLFFEHGLILEHSTDYIDLLHLREQDQDLYPWFYIIGSRWFASIPESVKPEIRESLKNLVRWHKHVFNYHPRSLEPEIRTLNWELEFSYNFTEHFLTTPEKPADAVKIITSTFESMFEQSAA